MADTNEIRISSSLSAIAVLDETIGGNALTAKQTDQNIGSVGGNYNSLTYTGSDAIKYTGIVNVTSTTAIGAGAFVGTPTSSGTAPTSARAVAIHFTSELGSPGPVIVTIGSQIHANLDVGEGCVIPIAGSADAGLAIANIKIHATAYSLAVTEATVVAVLIGV